MRTTVYVTMMVFCVGAMSMIAGCGVAPSDEPLATETEELQRSEPAERAVTTLPIRSEDLVDLAAMEATLSAACPAPATCPGFGSCANWSATSSCGGVACGFECAKCNIKTQTCISGIDRSTFTSRFRVCFNSLGQSCTEFQVFTATTCQTIASGDCCSQSPGTCGIVEPF